MFKVLVRCLNSSRNKVATLTLVLALGLTAGPAILSQEDGAAKADPEKGATEQERPRPSSLVERSRVELAMVEAVVLDRKGRHVRGVDASAFTLISDGEEIPIVSIDEVDLTLAASQTVEVPIASLPEQPAPLDAPETDPGSATGEVADTTAAEDELALRRRVLESRLRGPRWFVMIFDGYNNVSPLRASQIRRAAKKWMDSNLRPQDRVAVYEFNPYLSSLSGFTDNRMALEDAIESSHIFPATNIGREFIDQRLEAAERIPREFLEQSLINAGNFGSDLLRAEQDQFYGNVHQISDILSGLEGTRAVLLFSGGFPLTRARTNAARGGLTPRFKAMLRSLEAGGVRVFTYDIGVEGGFTDASERTNYRLTLDELGLGTEWLDTLQLGATIDANNAHQELLVVLGNETGGRFFRGHDYNTGLEAADDDLSHYYLVAYRPSDLPSYVRKNDYGQLKLKVEGNGLRVISRRGTFNTPVPTPPSPPEAIAMAPTEPIPEPEDQPVEIQVHPLFYPSPDGQTLVVLPIRIQGPLEPIEIDAETVALDMDVTTTASLEGQVIDSVTRSIRLSVPVAQSAALDAGVRLREAMLLPPSKFDLEVTVRLNGRGRDGRWIAAQIVPKRERARFGLTDLAVMHPADSTPLVYDVFRRQDAVAGTRPPAAMPDPLGEGAESRPAHYIDGGYSKGVPLLAQIQITSPPPPSEATPSPLRMDWELIPGAGGESIAPPVQYRRLQMDAENRMFDVVAMLDLKAIAPGAYTLRLTAANLIDDDSVERSVPLVITP